MLLNSSHGVSYPDLSTVISYTITNSLIGKTDSTDMLHEVKREVNGYINSETLISLSIDWLPISIEQLEVPFGEQEQNYSLLDFSLDVIPEGFCE